MYFSHAIQIDRNQRFFTWFGNITTINTNNISLPSWIWNFNVFGPLIGLNTTIYSILFGVKCEKPSHGQKCTRHILLSNDCNMYDCYSTNIYIRLSHCKQSSNFCDSFFLLRFNHDFCLFNF